MGGIYIKGVLPGGASDNKITKGMSFVLLCLREFKEIGHRILHPLFYRFETYALSIWIYVQEESCSLNDDHACFHFFGAETWEKRS